MRLNRRNVVLGLGTIVAGGGTALGTGAFSTVEADRTITVSTAGDASALLSLDDTASGYASSSNGTITINLDGSAGTGNADGLNIDATTVIDPLINVANEGDAGVGLYVSSPDIGDSVTSATDSDGDQVLRVDVTTSDNTSAGTVDLKFFGGTTSSIVDDETSAPPHTSIGSGSNEDIGLEIDTTSVDGSAGDISAYSVDIDSVTFVAESSL
ncbi:hypothetical protein [Natrinema salifodinae]|uniref:SipW-cognate class signal peptide n=1 Tax=Natrinema salifodinae TaxID=1202768 RepID=A0A1I0PRI2_9EURY|nr:hypothetical protein [Natrinema salifodinae]SEW16976.1 hypothetical protein SAMN05216285_2856 [Natrinema salifodinae]